MPPIAAAAEALKLKTVSRNGDRADARRDDAEAGQDGEAEIAGVVRGERLQALGVRRREAALFDELRQVKRDLHGSCPRRWNVGARP